MTESLNEVLIVDNMMEARLYRDQFTSKQAIPSRTAGQRLRGMRLNAIHLSELASHRGVNHSADDIIAYHRSLGAEVRYAHPDK